MTIAEIERSVMIVEIERSVMIEIVGMIRNLVSIIVLVNDVTAHKLIGHGHY